MANDSWRSSFQLDNRIQIHILFCLVRVTAPETNSTRNPLARNPTKSAGREQNPCINTQQSTFWVTGSRSTRYPQVCLSSSAWWPRVPGRMPPALYRRKDAFQQIVYWLNKQNKKQKVKIACDVNSHDSWTTFVRRFVKTILCLICAANAKVFHALVTARTWWTHHVHSPVSILRAYPWDKSELSVVCSKNVKCSISCSETLHGQSVS